jgi:hypothetical protein
MHLAGEEHDELSADRALAQEDRVPRIELATPESYKLGQLNIVEVAQQRRAPQRGEQLEVIGMDGLQPFLR